MRRSATMYFKPSGETGGHFHQPGARFPPAHPPAPNAVRTNCLKTSAWRGSASYAWANPSTPEGLGERVISGFPAA